MKHYIVIILLVFLSKYSLALDIEEAIESTISNNAKVKIALEKLEESKELLVYSKGEKLPTITSTISGNYLSEERKNSKITTTPETFTDTYKITISQNLYDGGYNNLEIERSEILIKNELIKFKSTIQELVLDAIEGYLKVVNYEKSLEATKKNYDSVLKAYDETKTRFNLGSATLYDLQSGEASFASAKTNLYAAEQNLLISQKSFKRIVGLSPNNLEDFIDIEKSLSLESLTNNVLDNNLDIKLIQNEIANKKILLLKEKKLKLPSLDLSASGSHSNSDRLEPGSENTNGSISLTLKIPLYKKGQDNSNIRKYVSQIAQSEIKLDDETENIKILISNIYKDFKISEYRIKSNLIIVKSINTALKSLNAEYKIGTKSISDLVDQEEKLLNANVDLLNSQRDLLLNYFKLKSLDASLINLFDKYLPSIN